jgi:aspartyl-tRNA(Asn)/glutamyl-tRNA(Gln) amidotransferase subunit C
MKISREDVLRVAELAHLELSAEEVETFRGQLDEILTYIEKLNELDTANVEPMAQVLSTEASAGNPALREDKEIASNVAKDVLAGAPDPSPPYFRVPKVVDR